MLLNQLNNKIIDLSGPFSNATKNIKKQIKDRSEKINRNIMTEQNREVDIDRSI